MTLYSRVFMIVMLASVALGGFAAEPERALKPAAKGYELYSWQRSDGAWLYSLLPGTNRSKEHEEIVAASADLSTLKRRLAALARDEQVFWGPAPDGRSWPDASIVTGLNDYCTTLQIDLHVVQ